MRTADLPDLQEKVVLITGAATGMGVFSQHGSRALAAAQELSNGLLVRIEAVVGHFVDPAIRIACGVRLYLHAARAEPLFGEFVGAAGLHLTGPDSLVHEYLPSDIADGQQTARFADMPMDAALDLVAGTALAALLRISSGQARPDYAEQAAAAILRGLGVPPRQASRLVLIKLPHLANVRTRTPAGP